MNKINFERARLLQIECELQGMIAENRWREYKVQAPAYVEDGFVALINRIQELIHG